MDTAGEHCIREVVVCEPREAVVQAARRMLEHHVGCLVVVEHHGADAFPVGIVTDRDVVVGLVASGVREPGLRPVGEVMTSPAIVARLDDSLTAVLYRMRSNGVRRLPVVDERGALAGMLSFDDVLERLVDEMRDLVALLGRERRRERGELPALH